MAVTRLTVANLRNLLDISLSLNSSLNIIYGENGSGKTSLLEAVYMLGMGRSFRSARAKPVINHNASQITLFGEVVSGGITKTDKPQIDKEIHKIGLQKTRKGETLIKVDGDNVLTAARLAEHLPVLTINANSFDLIEGPAKPRRQLLDWLAFHVEPSFLNTWKALQHCLKQRNSLLRRGRIDRLELRPWDAQLIELTAKIDAIRQETFEPFLASVQSLKDLLPDSEVALEYKPGWNRDHSYEEVLEQSLERDLNRGYTHYGPHRSDIRITTSGHSAGDVLSRGQQKVLVCALILAQGMVFRDLTGKTSVYLVDDLASELDEVHRKSVGHWLSELNVQILITGVEKEPLLDMWPNSLAEGQKTQELDKAVFHVKHGKIEKEEPSFSKERNKQI
ncbi:MAG: DNA replication/repair protein RecF [Cellvibrionaceae bacterium]